VATSLRIGLLHLSPRLGALDANRALIESGTRAAAGLGAEWIISGELVVCGYRFAPVLGTDWVGEQPDPWMRRLGEVNAELGVVSFVSHPERDSAGGRLFNSLFVIGRDGRLLGRQRKLRPTPVSEGWANRGEFSRPIVVDGLKIGLLVCADAYAAEPAVRLRTAGAEMLASPAAWWPGRWGPNGEWEARTRESGLPLIVCKRTGREGASHMVGAESVIVDRGAKLLTLRATESTVFVVECDLDHGHIASCELAATTPVITTTGPVRVR
jgi:predicted amidohydrolase